MTRYVTSRGALILGRWIPLPAAAFAGLTAALSILSALAPSIGAASALAPVAVWSGEIWRLLTWAFLTPEPLSLIFACLLIGSLGADLCRMWGTRRFVFIYLTCAALSGGVACLLARALPEAWLMRAVYASPWAVVDALIIAWATFFPGGRIFVFLVLPAQGRTLIWLTVGMTVLFAAFEGWRFYLPHFVAQGLMGLYLDRLRLARRFWLRLRLLSYERRLRRRSAHLTVVRRDDDQRPPTYH
jgi:membrane associated rhomboid family serine protease